MCVIAGRAWDPLVKSHRNVLETFDELLGAARTLPPGQTAGRGRQRGRYIAWTAAGIRGVRASSSTRVCSQLGRPASASSASPIEPPRGEPPSRGRQWGARDSLSPSNHRLGAVGRSTVRRTEEQNSCSVSVSGPEDDLADGGCRRDDTGGRIHYALPPPYRAAAPIGTTIPSPGRTALPSRRCG
jgi:hypothetical protein